MTIRCTWCKEEVSWDESTLYVSWRGWTRYPVCSEACRAIAQVYPTYNAVLQAREAPVKVDPSGTFQSGPVKPRKE